MQTYARLKSLNVCHAVEQWTICDDVPTLCLLASPRDSIWTWGPIYTAASVCTTLAAAGQHQIHPPAGLRTWPDFNYSLMLFSFTCDQ